MKKFRQVDEGLVWVLEGVSIDDQVSRLKEWAKSTQCLVPVVRIGVGAEKVDFGIPEGMPDLAKLKEDIPAGMGHSTINLEWRRISGFTQADSPIHKITQAKRENVWVQILEGLHHTEAKVLTAVKDGKLLGLYPKLERILPALGITEYNKPKAKRKTKAKKEK
tara:strand:- start:5321 stop:5812 length:492 start_codon:yes stop_codon:yes gene_type:complete